MKQKRTYHESHSPLLRSFCRLAVMAALVIGMMAAPQQTFAEDLNATSRLRARPGERGRTIIKLRKGTKVRVLQRQGRWVKISARGRVGWVTRSQIGERVSKKKRNPRRARMNRKKSKKWQSRGNRAVGADAVEEEEKWDEVDEDESWDEGDEEWDEASDEGESWDDEGDDGWEDDGGDADEFDDFEDDGGMDEEDPFGESRPSKNKKRMAKKRVGKGDVVFVKTEAAVFEGPSAKSEEMFFAMEGEEMKVIKKKGKWVELEDADGTRGWMLVKYVAGEEGVEGGARSGDVSMSPRLKPGKWNIGLNAELGLLSKSQSFTSQGTGIFGEYGLKNTAPAVRLSAGVMKPAGKLAYGARAGALITMGGSLAVPGDESLAWRQLSIGLDLVGSYKITPKYSIVATVGYEASSTTVGQGTSIQVPSERLSGFKLGAYFHAPNIKQGKIYFLGGLEYLLGASFAQTEGLKEGDRTAATSADIVLRGGYRLNPKIDLVGGYSLGLDRYAFGGVNQRDAAAINGKRSDTSHVLLFGASYAF